MSYAEFNEVNFKILVWLLHFQINLMKLCFRSSLTILNSIVITWFPDTFATLSVKESLL